MPIDVIDYSNTVFYKIYCKDPAVNDVYVGHTTNFVQRKYNHKRTCIKENDSNHNLKVYKFIREHGGWDNWKMDIIGYKDCYDHYEARKAEQKYFETLQATLNSIEPLPKPKPRPTKMPKEKKVWNCDVCRTTCQTEKALIVHEETNKHKCNVNRQPTNEMPKNKTPKNAKIFSCKTCNFKCSKESNYNKHLLTAKHKMITNDNNKMPKNAAGFTCECGKSYKFTSGLSRHKKICDVIKKGEPIENQIIETEDIDYKTMFLKTMEQNNELMNIITSQAEKSEEMMVVMKDIIPK